MGIINMMQALPILMAEMVILQVLQSQAVRQQAVIRRHLGQFPVKF